jgi:hypothetical protein
MPYGARQQAMTNAKAPRLSEGRRVRLGVKALIEAQPFCSQFCRRSFGPQIETPLSKAVTNVDGKV